MRYQDNRKDTVFRCIVELYIESALPVGSRAVSRRYGGSLSPASIRNVMADLEEEGLIGQPHTSAGRIPTAIGYRYYVNQLIKDFKSQQSEMPSLSDLLRAAQDIEDIAEKASRFLANLTHNAGVFFVKNIRRMSALSDQSLNMTDDAFKSRPTQDRLYVDGTSHVFEQPEFNDIQRAHVLLRALEVKEEITSFLERDLEEENVHVYIGEEMHLDPLKDVSLVVKHYSCQGQPMGCVGVIGPTRMRYDQAMGVVSHLADSMTDFLNHW